MRGYQAARAAVISIIAAAVPGIAMAQDGGEAFGGFIILIGLTCLAGMIYFLPTIIAANRHHPQIAAIFVVNLFLGWTLLGWVWALAWSLMAIPEKIEPATVVHVATQPPPTAPAIEMPADPTARQLKALFDLKEQGLLSEDEYQEKRKKVLDAI